jgi:hypothetical protein
MNISVVRPLVDALYEKQDLSISIDPTDGRSGRGADLV